MIPKFNFAKIAALALTVLLGAACSSPVMVPSSANPFTSSKVTVKIPNDFALPAGATPTFSLTAQTSDGTVYEGLAGTTTARSAEFQFSGLPKTSLTVTAYAYLDGEVYFKAVQPLTSSTHQLNLAEAKVLPVSFDTPYASPIGAGTAIHVSTPTVGAAIRYTTDGTSVTPTSPLYDQATGISTVGRSSFLIKAVAYRTGLEDSRESRQAYNVVTTVSSAPAFNKAAGTYSSTISVEITAAYGANIYYTLDGSNPTASSTAYTGPITISTSKTLNAVAQESGKNLSSVTSAAYTINTSIIVQSEAPVFSPAGGTFNSTQTVTITPPLGGTVYYTTNGTVPTTASTPYTTPLTVSATQTIKAIAKQTGRDVSAVVSETYVIDPNALTKTAKPSISPASGTFATAPQVTITGETGATFTYSLNGAQATAYTGPFTLPSTAGTYEISAWAVVSGKLVSDPASAILTINPNQTMTAKPVISPVSGTYSTTQLVTITSADGNAEIFYTTDGTEPATAAGGSTLKYNGVITQDALTKVYRAKAVAPGKLVSQEADPVTITVNSGLTKAATPVILGGGNATGSASISISSTTANATIYYTTDGSVPSTASNVYNAPFTLGAGTWTVKAVAAAPGYALSDVATSGPFIITPNPTATPVITPASGSFTSAQTVTITCPAPDAAAAIYYTLDGSTPTEASTVYSGPFPVAEAKTWTIKAVAKASGKTLSAVALSQFTIGSSAVRIYYKKTSGAAPTIWMWEGTGTDKTVGAAAGNRPIMELEGKTWPGPAMTLEAAGWYYYEIPAKYYPLSVSLNVKFDGSSAAALVVTGPVTGNNYYNGSAWSKANPDGPTASATPAGGSFSGSTTITLNASNPASGTYAWDNGAAVTYTNGQTLTFGSDWPEGTSKVITLTNGTASVSYVFNKVTAPTAYRIYYKKATGSAPTIWMWEDTGRAIMSLEGKTWPGPAMTADSSAPGWYYYEVPAKYYPITQQLDFKFDSGAQVNLPGGLNNNKWYNGSTWSNTNPDTPAKPVVTVTPAGATFNSSQTVSISVTGAGLTSAAYSYDNVNWTAFASASGGTITNGSSLTDGQTFTLYAKATNSVGTTNAGPFTFTKSTTVLTFPDTLGALYTPTATKFRLWSPDSTSVSVDVAGQTWNMTKVTDFAGYTDIYETTVNGNLIGQEYQLRVNSAAVRDPYALMVTAGTTKGVIVDMANITPTGGSWAARPTLTNREDSIIYEVHVRDFTIDANSGVDAAKRGKYAGMTQTGTTYNSAKTGIDHLKELGVTHVQLLPVYDFATGMYNWGYDPANYNVPEEQYALASTPEGRIQEFKDMINEYHKNGIRVVMDVVYNHTYGKEVFSPITGKYYTGTDLSGCGNSIDSGNPMVSRMIRDSLEQWVTNYNIDGFRFDLIGIFHYAEVRAWGEYLNSKFADRNLLIYGEPWNGYATDPADSLKVRMGKVPAMASGRVGVFNGKFREDIKGNNDGTSLAYMANGPISWWGAIAAGSRGSLTAAKSTAVLANDWDSMFAYDPEQSINYISAHDNYDLWDKIVHSGLTGGAGGYAGRVDKFGMGIILTSQGIPFIHAGDEFLRSKVWGGNWTYAHNSYNAPDDYNMIRWADKITNANINKYYKDTIALRRSLAGLRLTTWDEIKAKVTTKLNAGANNAAGINCVNDTSLPAGVVVNEIDSDGVGGADQVVVFNNGNNFTVTLPAGSWTKVLDASGAVSASDALCEGTAVTVFKKN